ncbi:MAG: HD domain-containing protein, partial [Anaerolineales bacterium]
SLQRAGYDRETVLAGFLHDAVEDAGVTVPQLEARFGRRVAQLVEVNTEDKALARLDRPREVIERCHQVGREALLVKAADLEDNLAFYLKEANREMLGWLAGLLDHFLSTSSSAIGSEAVWKSLSIRRREVLGMMDSQ